MNQGGDLLVIDSLDEQVGYDSRTQTSPSFKDPFQESVDTVVVNVGLSRLLLVQSSRLQWYYIRF